MVPSTYQATTMKRTTEIAQNLLQYLNEDQTTSNLIFRKLTELRATCKSINELLATKHKDAKTKLKIQATDHLTVVITTTEKPKEVTTADYDIPPAPDHITQLQAIARSLAKEQKVVIAATIVHTIKGNEAIELSFNVLLGGEPAIYRSLVNPVNKLLEPVEVIEPTYTPPTAHFYKAYLEAWENARSALLN